MQSFKNKKLAEFREKFPNFIFMRTTNHAVDLGEVADIGIAQLEHAEDKLVAFLSAALDEQMEIVREKIDHIAELYKKADFGLDDEILKHIRLSLSPTSDTETLKSNEK
jgi:hypothetical protein